MYHPSPTVLSNHRDKQPAEAALYDSDLDFTILQPAMFMQQFAGPWQSATRSGRITGASSPEARMAYVDYRDVAEGAAEAFVTDRFAYGTFELATPGMYTRHDLGGLMGGALGRPVTAGTAAFNDWADTMRLPAPLRDGLEAMNAHYDQHGFHGGNGLVLTAMLGCDPRTVSAFIDELARG